MMANMRKSVVLWDVDGTLASTFRLYPEAYRRALAPYIGRAMSDEEIFAHRSHSELRFLRTFSGPHYEACLADFRKHYAELHATHFDGLYDGISETLGALRDRGVRMGIVTGKSRLSFEATTALADIGHFEVLIMDDDVSEPKPSPEGILAALSNLQIEPHDAIYVGDSITDIMAAEAAGTGAAAAMWSKTLPERLSTFIAALADHPNTLLLNQPHDLLSKLED